MTQPPDRQPPQGAFGAPYDPPPVPPGYGYPQAPPGQAPGPHAQQPGPYAQQPGPYGQQAPGGYGYPPQPPHPGAPAPGGSGRFKGRPAVLIGATLAVLLIAGGGVWLATSGGEDGKKSVARGGATGRPSASPSVGKEKKADTGPDVAELNAGRKPGEAKVLWLRKNDVDLPGKGAVVNGPWIAGDIIAKGMYRTVSGYSQADGTERWSLELPTEICSAPALPNDDGKIVIGIEASSTDDSPDCSILQVIDLKTGKPGWKKTVPSNGLLDIQSEVAMSVNGDTVTYARAGGADAYRISDGTRLFGRQPGSCQPFRFTSGPRMIAFTSCANEAGNQQIQETDPVTGKPKWTYGLEPGWSLENIFSVDPLVVALTDFEQSRTIALRDDGTLRSQIDGSVSGIAAADANTLYTATGGRSRGGGEIRNKVIAFDLNTGKSRWEADSQNGQMIKPLRMEGDQVLLSVDAEKGRGGAIATLSPSGGTPRTVLRYPASAARYETSMVLPKVIYADGRAILTRASVESDNDEDELELTTMLVFGQ